MANSPQFGLSVPGAPHSEDSLIRTLLEGTVAHTGPRFFHALVQQVALALGVAGVWVTELSPDRKRLRAFAFWFQGEYVHDYEYAIEGTPCEPVIEDCSLFHVPDNIIQLYPGDNDLAKLQVVSYLGIPLTDGQRKVLGHLGALDTKPIAATDRVKALFRIFAARAAAEVERIRAERSTEERERQLSALLDSAWESIFVIDGNGHVREANRSARDKFGLNAAPTPFENLLAEAAREPWRKEHAALAQQDDAAWVMNGLELRRPCGTLVPAEASISAFVRDRQRYWTIILRDLEDQRRAEQRLAAAREESRRLREELEDLRPVGQLIGESPAMRAVFGQIRQVAATEATVLVQGETGTGKELVARAIHEASPRRAKPLIRVNCGAIPGALMESEFFGHEKGAFTGATERREGRFALADGGTLFLDEIGELPLDLQVKLLRVLQEGEFEPVGSARTRSVNVRVVAATNRDLAHEVDRARFRADLYYRLNVFPLKVPPLRERGDDILLLAEAFLARLGKRLGRRFRPLSAAAKLALRGYDWPGNVRELENVLERAAILSRGEDIQLDPRLLVPTAAATEPLPPPQQSADGSPAILNAHQFQEFERRNIQRALDACAWRVAGDNGAAKLLGVAPSTLASRMKALGVTRDKSRAAHA